VKDSFWSGTDQVEESKVGEQGLFAAGLGAEFRSPVVEAGVIGWTCSRAV